MLDGEGPKCGVGDVRPMDGRMQHHGSCNRHDGSDVAFGDPVVMVSADASESNYLLKLRAVARELGGRERFRVVGEILLRRHSCVAAHSLEALLCLESFVRVQADLMLDEDKTRGVVDEDAATGVHVVKFCLSGGGE